MVWRLSASVLAKELHDGVCNDILAVNIMMQTNKEEAETS